MSNYEKKLSKYIDQLNEDKMPKEHKESYKSDELEELLETVRSVRSLKQPVFPDKEFENRLYRSLNGSPIRYREKANHTKRFWITGAAVVAAAAVLFVSMNTVFTPGNNNVVYAMEQALKELHAYHGIIEVTETNELGETMTQSKREVWADKNGNYYVKELDGFSKGQITVNNGKQKWQLRPEEQKSYVFEAFPDPYRFTFEIGKEVEEVKKAQTVKKIGEETIAGRNADVFEVAPDGGDPYKLWIDQETDLPLQRQTAMQNAIQYKVTYTEVDFIDSIPGDLLAYSLPSGYEEVNTDQEQYVNTIEEAENIAGFIPAVPENIPEGYHLEGISVELGSKAVRLHYSSSDKKQTVVIRQSKAGNELKPDSAAVLGTVNNNIAEILTTDGAESIRWQEQGFEYKVLGNAALDQLSGFAKEMTEGEVKIPAGTEEIAKQPQIQVPVDLAAEENEQKSVDAGHSPWKLDPVFVTQVFASLLISPEGIQGDYPIPYDDIKIIENNGKDAIAEVNGDVTPARYVYLKRLVRQDDTGIWTVVGYDPVEAK